MRLRTFGMVLATVSLSAVTGCGKGSTAAPPRTEPTAGPKTVKVAAPQPRVLAYGVEAPGQLLAFEQAPLHAKISGYVRRVEVDIGDPVRAGQLLADIDMPELEAEHRQAEAAIVKAEAEVEFTRHALAVAEAEYKRSKSQFDRLTRLGKGGVIDPETVAEAEFGHDSGLARRDQELASLRVRRGQLELARADRDRVAALLGYRRIVAPFDGVVAQRHVDPGHLLQAGPGAKPLFVVARIDAMRLQVDVPEKDSSYLRVGVGFDRRTAAGLVAGGIAAVSLPWGSPVVAKIHGLSDSQFDGRVARTSWVLHQATRTLRVEADLLSLGGVLRPGMYAQATVQVEVPVRWAVPAAAIQGRGDQQFCFLVDEGRATRVAIQVGRRDSQWVEVLGVRAGSEASRKLTGREHFVVDGARDVTDGQPIRVAE